MKCKKKKNTIKAFNQCGSNQFVCKHDMHTCISLDLVCDGVNDCADHSDEVECDEVRRIRNRSKKDESSKSDNLIGLLTHTHNICAQTSFTSFFSKQKQKINLNDQNSKFLSLVAH